MVSGIGVYVLECTPCTDVLMQQPATGKKTRRSFLVLQTTFSTKTSMSMPRADTAEPFAQLDLVEHAPTTAHTAGSRRV